MLSINIEATWYIQPWSSLQVLLSHVTTCITTKIHGNNFRIEEIWYMLKYTIFPSFLYMKGDGSVSAFCLFEEQHGLSFWMALWTAKDQGWGKSYEKIYKWFHLDTRLCSLQVEWGWGKQSKDPAQFSWVCELVVAFSTKCGKSVHTVRQGAWWTEAMAMASDN